MKISSFNILQIPELFEFMLQKRVLHSVYFLTHGRKQDLIQVVKYSRTIVIISSNYYITN
jgi:hypothetical protein